MHPDELWWFITARQRSLSSSELEELYRDTYGDE